VRLTAAVVTVRRMAILRERQVWRRSKRPSRRRATDRLTDEEEANVRSALRVLQARLGSWPAVADALESRHTMVTKQMNGHRHIGAGTALRVARLLGTAVEGVLGGEAPPGACSACGRPVLKRRQARRWVIA
jgi:hypothetical protein